MKCIKKPISNTIIIKNSKFICNLAIIYSPDEAINFINKIKKIYPDASHNCSCYIVNNFEKADDDGEPTLTAGVPMLEVLKKNNLTNIVCVTTRYFGGIKLGGGGLIRAYAKSVSEALSVSEILNIIPGTLVEIAIDYDKNEVMNYQLNQHNFFIKNIKYDLKIIYNIEVPKNQLIDFENLIKSIDHTIIINQKKEIFLIDRK